MEQKTGTSGAEWVRRQLSRIGTSLFGEANECGSPRRDYTNFFAPWNFSPQAETGTNNQLADVAPAFEEEAEDQTLLESVPGLLPIYMYLCCLQLSQRFFSGVL
jgi:hypothetical protein